MIQVRFTKMKKSKTFKFSFLVSTSPLLVNTSKHESDTSQRKSTLSKISLDHEILKLMAKQNSIVTYS